MFELSTVTSFVAVVIGLFLIPGPAVLLVVTRTVQAGRRTGILTGFGIATGDLVHTLCAAAGLSALLMTSSLAFNLVKFAGAGYLLYLGIRALMEKTPPIALPKLSAVGPARAFFQAIPAEVLNPKTALFFLAVLPQFVHPERGSSFLQFLTLGLIFVGMGAIYTTLIAMLIRPLGKLIRRFSWISRWRNKIIGTTFISLGVKVALQHR